MMMRIIQGQDLEDPVSSQMTKLAPIAEVALQIHMQAVQEEVDSLPHLLKCLINPQIIREKLLSTEERERRKRQREIFLTSL